MHRLTKKCLGNVKEQLTKLSAPCWIEVWMHIKKPLQLIKIVKKSVDWSSSLLPLFSIWKYVFMKACHIDSLTLFLLGPKIDTLQHCMFANIEFLTTLMLLENSQPCFEEYVQPLWNSYLHTPYPINKSIQAQVQLPIHSNPFS